MLLVAEIMPATSDSVPLIGKLTTALFTFIFCQMRCSDFARRPAVRQVTTCTMAYCNWIRKMLPIDERFWWVWSPIQCLCFLRWTT